MKNYKNLIPIALVILFLLGIYMKYDKNISLNNKYNEYLNLARAYKEKGIHVDAEANYMLAAELKPSVELAIEIGEYYAGYDRREAISWGEELILMYKDDPQAYEFLLKMYIETEYYEDFYDVYATVLKRGIVSESIANLEKSICREYYFHDEYEDIGCFASGYCKVSKEGYWCYVTEKGTRVIGLNYIEAGDFISEVTPVKDKLEDVYFIDMDGNKKYVLDVENLQKLGCYDEEKCTVFNGQEWSVYTITGELIHGGYTNISAMGNGAVAVEQNGKWSLLDMDGNKMISDSFDDIKQDDKGIVCRKERVFVQKNGVYYMVDLEGNQVGNNTFEDVHIFNADGYAAVKMDGKWGFIDTEGKIVIEPTYNGARSFSNGYAAVKMDGKWGFIDINNEVFLDYEFEDARDFTSSGSVFVFDKGEWKLLRLYSGT